MRKPHHAGLIVASPDPARVVSCSTTTRAGLPWTSTRRLPRRRVPWNDDERGAPVEAAARRADADSLPGAVAAQRARRRHLSPTVLLAHPTTLPGRLHAGCAESRRPGAGVCRHLGAAPGHRPACRARHRGDHRRRAAPRRTAHPRVQSVSGPASRRRRGRRVRRVPGADRQTARRSPIPHPGPSATPPQS